MKYISNGIRFSISDLSPPTTRILPTVYVYRVGISLYDAQFDPSTGKRIPIPKDVIEAITESLLRFKTICSEFFVHADNIRILATEATRTAINSSEFRTHIKHRTGLTVELLAKEEEGHVGAMGIASSFSNIRGLVMDLGGGSAQVTWIISEKGNIRTSPKIAISFPYGAAALTKRLADCDSSDDPEGARKAFRDEIRNNFQNAFLDLEVPEELVKEAQAQGGFHVYLSGGGFRGWGYLLLSLAQKAGQHYPISIINGFKVSGDEIRDTARLKEVAADAKKIFRVSDRRRYQVPSVAFLINAIVGSIQPQVAVARFCQGGVREGIFFKDLSPEIRAQDPLTVATMPYARSSALEFATLLLKAIPPNSKKRSSPSTMDADLVQAYCNLLYVHTHLNKEAASVAALYCSSTGLLASAHGISHSARARLAVMLDDRYEGELPPREEKFKAALCELLTTEEVWWCKYVGCVGWLIGIVYPAGVIGMEPRLGLSARWSDCLGKQGNKSGIELTVSVPKHGTDNMTEAAEMRGDIKKLEKIGKKKSWSGGRNGWGMAVKAVLAQDL